MIISLISQKGGVGKSALCRLLAVEFIRAGWTAKIADLDTAQGTATKWKMRRDRASLQPEVPVEKFATVERAIREAERFDLMLLDGPAHAERGGRDMARAADLVIMPTGYSLDDLEAQIEAASSWKRRALIAAKSGSCSAVQRDHRQRIRRRGIIWPGQKSTFLSMYSPSYRRSDRGTTQARPRQRLPIHP